MKWTLDKIDRIPQVYKDFMLFLAPVLESRSPETILKINSVHVDHIYSFLQTQYSYDVEQFNQITETLRSQGLIKLNRYGFVKPTPEGERLIRLLTQQFEPVGIPAWPTLETE